MPISFLPVNTESYSNFYNPFIPVFVNYFLIIPNILSKFPYPHLKEYFYKTCCAEHKADV